MQWLQILKTNRYHFFETDTEIWSQISIDNISGQILSGISYHSKARIRVSAHSQKVKYWPIISVGRYIGRSIFYAVSRVTCKCCYLTYLLITITDGFLFSHSCFFFHHYLSETLDKPWALSEKFFEGQLFLG